MANHTWGQVERGLYHNWKFTKPARAIFAHILAECPNQYGIYDPSPYGIIIDWWTGIFDRDVVITALRELEGREVILQFRNEECLWVIKRFKRHLPNLRNELHLKGVINHVNQYPEISDRFFDLYGIQIAETGIQIKNSVIQIEEKKKEKKKEKDTSSTGPVVESNEERIILNYLKEEYSQFKKFTFNRKKYLDFIRDLMTEFPEVDVLAVLKTLKSWEIGQRKETINWTLRIRNFVKNALKYGRDLKYETDSPPPLEKALPDATGLALELEDEL